MEAIETEYGSDEEMIQALAVAAEAAKSAQNVQDVMVRAARRRGIPWEKISRSLGVSKQAAWGKYGERATP